MHTRTHTHTHTHTELNRHAAQPKSCGQPKDTGRYLTSDEQLRAVHSRSALHRGTTHTTHARIASHRIASHRSAVHRIASAHQEKGGIVLDRAPAPVTVHETGSSLSLHSTESPASHRAAPACHGQTRSQRLRFGLRG
ncbi:hypothetical protein AK830_g8136 [Neonectria ditissima]|uniref:Uncharacterized protein n=1 Tax=Neonectria ditissima TaxID=78410 RepID=A0A0P7BDD4_9HYPO|nr:hypothetical protein AK830_g8136 [Neonectria ditissima]